MVRVGNPRGFTIVETIIVLAVTSSMFLIAMIMMSGQQAKTEFRQATGDVQAQLDDATNDVATGYYTFASNLRCDNFLGPSVSSSPGSNPEQGANFYCIVLGKAVQLRPLASGEFDYYTVVGRRIGSSGGPSSSLKDALATIAVAGGSYTQQKLQGGLTLAYASYHDTTGARQEISGFVVVSSLNAYSGGNNGAGVSSIDIIPISGSTTQKNTDFRNSVQAVLRAATPPPTNPAGGITICLDSGGTAQHIVLTIGNNGSLQAEVSVGGGPSSSDTRCTG